MNHVASVIAQIAFNYIEAGRDAGSETRLLLPGLTDVIAKEIHGALTAKGKRSFLVVRDDGKSPPDKEIGHILADGLTSVREGEMLIVALPGQISRIQDSIIGSGGTVRGQAFSDEWPWILVGENPTFSFSKAFLPGLVNAWHAPTGSQSWLVKLISQTIIPCSAGELRKAEIVLDDLLGDFRITRERDETDPSIWFNLEFLRHCGLPRPSDRNLLTGSAVNKYSGILLKLTRAVTNALEKGTSRDFVKRRAIDIAKGNREIEAILTGATNEIFDSLAREDHIPTSIFMFKSCFKNNPILWNQLDLDTISRLFTGAGINDGVNLESLKIELGAGEPGRVIPGNNASNVYTVHGSKLHVRARLDNDPGRPTDLVVLLRGQELVSNGYSGDPLEASVEIDTGEIGAYRRQVTVRVEVRQHGVAGDSTATHPVRLDLVGRDRPFFVLLLDSRETIDVSDLDQDDCSFARIDVDEPQAVEILCLDPSLSLIAMIDDDPVGINQVGTGPGHYTLDEPIDPAAAFTTASLLKVKQDGLVAAAYLGMEEVKRGQFTIEEDLREILFAGQNKRRLQQVLSVFNDTRAQTYPHLGGIEGATRQRVSIVRQTLENQEFGGLPVLINFSQLRQDISNISLGNYIFRPTGNDKTQDFDPVSLLETTQETIRQYRAAREKLLDAIRQRYHGDGRHPLYAASPTFFFNEDPVEPALCSYLDAYKLCLESLHNTEELKNTNDKFVLSWLDCIVCLDSEGNVPIILMGPWHPLVLAQRYMVQACLYDAASRFGDGKLGRKYHRLTPLLAGVVGSRWMPFAAPQNSTSMGAFHVSATTDPGWLIATSTTTFDVEKNKNYLVKLEREFGLEVANLSEVEPRDFEGYLRDFLKAYPSRRSISMRIAANYSPRRFMGSAQTFLLGLERDFGQRLPGGLHLLFKEKPSELDNFEWQDPPLLAYHVDHVEEMDLQENPVDIDLLQGGRLSQFEQTQNVKAPPRGNGLHAVFYEPLQELNTTAGSFNTSLHETGIVTEQDMGELGSRYRSILDLLDRVQNGKYLTTIRPGRSQIHCPWVVTPAQYVDPAAMVAMVGTKDKEQANSYILWDYKLGISGSHAGYFTLSRVHKDLETILSGNELLIESESAQDIVIELGKVGIALASEVVRSNTTAQGALGLVGALRLFQGTGKSPGVLKNDPCSVSFMLPVDSFEEVFKSLGAADSESDQRTDLLAVQLGINSDERHVSIAFLGIEAKYVSSTLGIDRAHGAMKQAKETVARITELANRGRKHGLERQAFLRLVSHGLRLSAPSRDRNVEVDSLILGAILRGDYQVVEAAPNTFVVSSEIGYSGKATIEMTPAAWIRLSPGHWPSPYTTPSSDLARVIEQLVSFSSKMFAVIRADQFANGKEEQTNTISNESIGPAQPKPEKIDEEDNETGAPSNSGERDEPEFNDYLPDHDDTLPRDIRFLDGVKVVVGTTDEWPSEGEGVYFHPSNTELNQLNVGIVGDLGTGKTQKIKALVRDITDQAASNRGQSIKFLIFDYKGDYVGQDFVERTGAKVVAPRDIPLNVIDPSDAESMNPELDKTNFLVEVFRKIYGGIGPAQDYNLKRAIRECYESCRSHGTVPSIYDVHARYEETLNKPDSVLSILSNFTSYRLFERDLTQVKTFSAFFSGVTVIDLKSLGTWDQGKNMLVVMLLNLFYDYMLKVEKKTYIGNEPQLRAIDSFLLVDEADQIMNLEFPVLRRILLQGREFGIGVILASQYLSHFKQDKEDYSEPLLTWILHKVPNISVRELSGIGLTDSLNEAAEKIKHLKPHHSFYKTSIGEARFMKNVTFYK